MTTPRIFNRLLGPRSEMQTDEAVGCTSSLTVDGDTYYAGYCAELADSAVYGSDSATYGAWTAASKAGTRYTVLSAGTPGANEVLWDRASGMLMTSASVTLYVRYLGYGRLWKWYEQGGTHVLLLPGLLDRDTAETVIREVHLYGTRYIGAAVSVVDNAAADIVVTVENEETADDEVLTISSGSKNDTSEFSSTLTVSASQHLLVKIAANAGGGMNGVLTLWRG